MFVSLAEPRGQRCPARHHLGHERPPWRQRLRLLVFGVTRLTHEVKSVRGCLMPVRRLAYGHIVPTRFTGEGALLYDSLGWILFLIPKG